MLDLCFSELSSEVPLPPAPSIYGWSLSGSHRGGLTQATGCVFLWGFPSQSYENTGFCCWYAGLVRLLGNMWVMNWLYVLHKSSYFMTKKKKVRKKNCPISSSPVICKCLLLKALWLLKHENDKTLINRSIVWEFVWLFCNGSGIFPDIPIHSHRLLLQQSSCSCFLFFPLNTQRHPIQTPTLHLNLVPVHGW